MQRSLTARGEFSTLAATYVLITAVAGPILMLVSDPLAQRLLNRRRREAVQPAG